MASSTHRPPLPTEPPEPPGGILAQLRADHAHVRALFHQFAMLGNDEDEHRERLVDDLCHELTLHTMLEEELFYPALRGVVEDSLLDDAELEHDSTRELIAQLSTLFPNDDYFNVAVAVLAEEVAHHVAQEETVLFRALAHAGIDQDALGVRLHARRAQLEWDLASQPPAIDGAEPQGLLHEARAHLRERRHRPR